MRMVAWRSSVLGLCMLGLGGGCGDDAAGTGPSVEQLRGLGVRIAGQNVLHGARAVAGEPNDLGLVPVEQAGVTAWGYAPVEIVGPLSPWEAELRGDVEAIQFVITNIGTLQGIQCAPPDVGDYAVELNVTSETQPGRAFNVEIGCTGDDQLRALPLQAHEFGPGGSYAGVALDGTGRFARLAAGSREAEVTEIPMAPIRHGVLATGDVVLASPNALHWLPAGASQSSELLTSWDIFTARAAQNGSAVYYTDGWQLHRLDLASREISRHGPEVQGAAVAWVAPDGSEVLVYKALFGSPPELWRVDIATDTTTPIVHPNGEAWALAPIALSPDHRYLLQMQSYFGTVRVVRFDLTTGQRVDLLDRAAEHVLGQGLGLSLSISDHDVSADFRKVAVCFDNITADPGGFRIDGSAVYVMDIDSGQTWFVSGGPDGRPVRGGGGYTGSLFEHVRLAPAADEVLFGRRYRTLASIWQEVP